MERKHLACFYCKRSEGERNLYYLQQFIDAENLFIALPEHRLQNTCLLGFLHKKFFE